MRGRETGEVVAAARYEGGFLPVAASRRHTPAAEGQDLLRKAKKMTNGARTTALLTAGGGREVFGAWLPPVPPGGYCGVFRKCALLAVPAVPRSSI